MPRRSLIPIRLPSPLSACLTAVLFLANMILPVAPARAELPLPKPGEEIRVGEAYNPPMIVGMKVNSDDPMTFDFIIDRGDDMLDGKAFERESQKLVKYFLAALTIPDSEVWVNLSPSEKDQMISKVLGLTEMGRDLLAQDYILKQVTASLTNPETALGQRYWNELYRRAKERFGTTRIPLDSFTKVWIMPDEAEVFERDGTALVVGGRLKLMVDRDYLTMKNTLRPESGLAEKEATTVTDMASEVFKETVLPDLERAVNRDKNFALVRQVYNSVILATWYKRALKDSLLGQVYVDKNKIAGVNLDDTKVNTEIYEQYIEALRRGVYNIVRDDFVPDEKAVYSRRYFSGGIVTSIGAKQLRMTSDVSDLSKSAQRFLTNLKNTDQYAQVRVEGFQAKKMSPALEESLGEYVKEQELVRSNLAAAAQPGAQPLIQQAVSQVIKEVPSRELLAGVVEAAGNAAELQAQGTRRFENVFKEQIKKQIQIQKSQSPEQAESLSRFQEKIFHPNTLANLREAVVASGNAYRNLEQGAVRILREGGGNDVRGEIAREAIRPILTEAEITSPKVQEGLVTALVAVARTFPKSGSMEQVLRRAEGFVRSQEVGQAIKNLRENPEEMFRLQTSLAVVDRGVRRVDLLAAETAKKTGTKGLETAFEEAIAPVVRRSSSRLAERLAGELRSNLNQGASFLESVQKLAEGVREGNIEELKGESSQLRKTLGDVLQKSAGEIAFRLAMRQTGRSEPRLAAAALASGRGEAVLRGYEMGDLTRALQNAGVSEPATAQKIAERLPEVLTHEGIMKTLGSSKGTTLEAARAIMKTSQMQGLLTEAKVSEGQKSKVQEALGRELAQRIIPGLAQAEFAAEQGEIALAKTVSAMEIGEAVGRAIGERATQGALENITPEALSRLQEQAPKIAEKMESEGREVTPQAVLRELGQGGILEQVRPAVIGELARQETKIAQLVEFTRGLNENEVHGLVAQMKEVPEAEKTNIENAIRSLRNVSQGARPADLMRTLEIRSPQMLDVFRNRQVRSAFEQAMAARRTEVATKGGIDLDSLLVDLKVKRDGKGVPLPISKEAVDKIKIDGLYPVVIDVKPVDPSLLPSVSRAVVGRPSRFRISAR